MPNDTEDVNLTNEEMETTETEETQEVEEVDWKAKYEEEAGRRKRLETKLTKSDTPKKAPSTSDEFDYGQEAYLIANNIKDQTGQELVRKVMNETGKSLKEVVNSKYFQLELKEMQELEATKNAIPSSKNRSAQSSQSTVDYWLAKGELPPASERELRTKVVNARIKRESTQNIFGGN